jgi:hypothetical protein
MRVFLSYARRDAASLAWPVRDALSAAGAAVWFDQELPPDEWALDAGLAETIAGCDAYVLCASDELFERAGYATQEIAWALRAGERALAVVARPGAVLPTIAATWPAVGLEGDDLAGRLAAALRGPPARLPELSPPAPRAALAPLPPVADLAAMRARVAHLRRFDEIPQEDLEALLSGAADHVRRRLLHAGEGLGWSGTLADVDEWPGDSFIRDLRWRLAGDRALVIGCESPDVERIAADPVPIVDWPAVPGWADNERRLALRHHLGRLRLFEHHLGHDALAARRRECIDALLALRLDGRLSWTGEPRTWDASFRAWRKLATSLEPPVAPGRRAVLRAYADDVAAVAATTAWWASAHGRPARQTFTVSIPPPPTVMTVEATPDGAARVSWDDGAVTLPAP